MCDDSSMESRLDEDNDQVVISLANEDCLAVASGRMIGGRENPYDLMAKIEVAPLENIDPTYEAFDRFRPRGDNLRAALSRVACRAIVLGNNDIRVFVPNELVAYNYFSAETITADRIDGDIEVKPLGGIRIEFSSLIK